MKHFTARYILVGHSFVEDHCISVDDEGYITAIGPAPANADVVDLGQVAIVPGLVNAHSHAFQRAIRGRTEWVDPTRPDEDFWTWREQMYAAATTYSPEDIFAVSRWTFMEMALSGITSVGEFHYLHHQPDGTAYEDANELAHQVIAAAREVGIRIALLRVGYRRGGHGKPTAPEQRRFVDPSDEHLLVRTEALRTRYAGQSDVTVGLAPHSIRAVSAETLSKMAETAREWDVPLHIHACEQLREIEESVAEYGKRPIEVFEDLGILDDRLTLVHATHLSELEVDFIAAARPTVCACPTTERNLGDGFLPAKQLVKHGVPIALGSDSHTNIDLWEDARCVEYHERLREQRRNVLASAALENPDNVARARGRTADVLFPMLAEHGARALRLPAGRLAPGLFGDFVALDLHHPTLIGADAGSLLTDICLTMTPGAVRDVYVGGKAIVEGGRHPSAVESAIAFQAIVD